MKLLIVDDSNIIRRAIEFYLKEFNMEICGSVNNGEDAVRCYKEQKPDVVTMDITMPGMDGLAALEQIMDFDPSASVIVISALKDKGTGIKALSLGASGFLSKPFTPDQLKEEIEAILEEKSA